MSLPNIPLFENLLKSISLSRPTSDGYDKLIVYEESVGQYETGKSLKIPEISIWYSANEKLTIEALCEKIGKQLEIRKHVSNAGIIKSLLYIYAGHPQKNAKPVDALNEILELIQTVDASQYFVLPIKDILPEAIAFGDFTIGPVDTDGIRYKCEKAGSDYFERYKGGLHGKISLSRSNIEVKIINCQQFLYKYHASIDSRDLFDRVLVYFESLSDALFEDFWRDFNEQQNLQIALGVPDIYDKIFRQMLLAQPLTIYSRIQANGKRHGYVVPQKIGLLRISIDFELGKKLDILRKELSSEYNFKDFNDTEIHQTIKSFVKFIAKAHRYLDDQKKDEGFLHFIIALDLLFGDATASTKSVSERTASLVSISNGENFEETKKKVSKLYAARSKYVHAGIPVNEDYIVEADSICRIVLLSLLRYQKYAINNNSEFDKWKKQLDYIANSLEIGEIVQKEFLLKIGAK